MLGYLNAGFGEPIGNEWWTKIHAIGFDGIRTDINETHREAVVDELGNFGKLSPIFLFGGGYMKDWTEERFRDNVRYVARRIKDEGYFTDKTVYFEIGNEPDIAVNDWKLDPNRLNDVFWDCYQTAKSINSKIEMITGGISNLTRNGLDWLDRFLYKDIPAGSIVGFHRYPNGRDTQKPHNGFQSRSHEWNRLQALAGGHKLFLTETGLSQGPHRIKRPFPLCWLNENHWISQEEQAAAMALEWAIWEPRGVLGMTWYQHRDGNYYQDLLNNYGIYAADGNEKAIVETFKNILL